MPRRIASQPEVPRGDELSHADHLAVQLQIDLWNLVPSADPMPDFLGQRRDEIRQRKLQPPVEPTDWTTPEGVALIAQMRAEDNRMRDESRQREEEPK